MPLVEVLCDQRLADRMPFVEALKHDFRDTVARLMSVKDHLVPNDAVTVTVRPTTPRDAVTQNVKVFIWGFDFPERVGRRQLTASVLLLALETIAGEGVSCSVVLFLQPGAAAVSNVPASQ